MNPNDNSRSEGNNGACDSGSSFRQTLSRARAWKAYIRTLIASLILRQSKLTSILAEASGRQL
jgi:hypothetical protein